MLTEMRRFADSLGLCGYPVRLVEARDLEPGALVPWKPLDTQKMLEPSDPYDHRGNPRQSPSYPNALAENAVYKTHKARFKRMHDFDDPAQGVWLWALARTSSTRNVVFVPEPKCHYDASRLHREDGPAVETYRGLLDAYCLQGYVVPKNVVMDPETITPEQCASETNLEARRIMIERMPGGFVRFLEGGGALLLDRRRNERDSQWESLYKLRDGAVMMCVVDPSTGRKYALSVPWSGIETCEAAQNWLSHGLDRRAVHRS